MTTDTQDDGRRPPLSPRENSRYTTLLGTSSYADDICDHCGNALGDPSAAVECGNPQHEMAPAVSKRCSCDTCEEIRRKTRHMVRSK